MEFVKQYSRFLGFALLLFVLPVQSEIRTSAATRADCSNCSPVRSQEKNGFAWEAYQRALLEQMSNSKVVAAAKRNLRKLQANPNPRPRCYRAVKDTQIKAGIIKEKELKGKVDELKYAKHAAYVLLRTGKYVDIGPNGFEFVKVNDPCMAPEGAVLVYSGKGENSIAKCGSEGCGHTETKEGDVGEGSMIFDKHSSKPVTGSCSPTGKGYTLTSVLVLRKDYEKALKASGESVVMSRSSSHSNAN